MPSEPVWMALEDCLDTLIDYRGKTPEKTKKGVPLITAKVVKGGIIEAPTEFIASDAYSAWMRRGLPKVGDVLLTTEAPLGEVAQLKSAHVALAQRIILLRGKPDLLDNGYLKYFFLTEQGRSRLEARATGTTVIGIKQSELRKVEVPIIQLAKQKSIAKTLAALDDKIALLRETNATLEAIAQALFKSWFVDFDPVRTKVEGRDPEGVPPEVADLFPSEFVDSELGGIPKGWRYVSLRDVVSIFDSKRIPLSGQDRAKRQGRYPYYGAASLMDSVDDYLFDGTYLLTGEDGSVADEQGFPITQYVWGKFWVNNHAHVLQGNNGVSTEHLRLSLRQTNIKPFITGAVQAKLSQSNMWRIMFLNPQREISEAFGALIEPLYARLRQNSDHAQTLTSLRDTLLPKLMSGKLRVLDLQAGTA